MHPINLIFTVNFIDCLFLSFYLFIVCVCMQGRGVCMLWHVCGGKRPTLESRLVGSGIKFKLSDWAAAG